MSSTLSNNEAAEYVIDLDGGTKQRTVTADRYDYDESGNLRLWLGGSEVATFRWWSGISLKQQPTSKTS